MKIAVGLSGGVDSSVAAALLKKEGHSVIGLTMQVWSGDEQSGGEKKAACIGPAKKADLENAREVAARLQIPFHVVDLTAEYGKIVLSYFTSEYREGRTPNPCVYCNRRLKFGALLEKARESGLDFDAFATGHYARVELSPQNGRYQLHSAAFLSKDQSYFLAMLSQEQLSKIMFPLSGLTKAEVRSLAREFGLETADKEESQDFYAGDYTELFKTPAAAGDIVDLEGKVLGRHKGIIHYTIGQRRGLGIAYSEPLYVVGLDVAGNRVIAGTEKDLYQNCLWVKNVNWVSCPPLKGACPARVKIRYRHAGAEAELIPLQEGGILVKFIQPVRAITPGQIAVFYSGDMVLGAGPIESCLFDT